jgi:2-polyprenyl-3-methyl-5-hydroxy-6-metoxy-1,4-benzoquinol methylase
VIQKESYIERLIDRICQINPLQRTFLLESLASLNASERNDLASYIQFASARALSTDYLAECYDRIVKDTLREQMYFQRHKKYRHSSFQDVARHVYFNDDYMQKYMHGLALTGYLWPNHRQLLSFFNSSLPRQKTGRYLEVGPGHGIYMVSAMRKSEFSRFEGIDLSPTSVRMTRDLLSSGFFGDFDDYQINEQDFLGSELDHGAYDALVMGEVLEHVERPDKFLARIRQIAADDAFIFITTPINAPAIDHIYLFDSYESIEKLVEESGLYVAQRLLVPYPGLDIKESMDRQLPVNVGLVLKA